jgi:hypothetical protein
MRRHALLVAVTAVALLATPGTALAHGPHHHGPHHYGSDHYGSDPGLAFGPSLRSACATAYPLLSSDERRICDQP